MNRISSILTSDNLSWSLENIIVFYGRGSSPLWSLLVGIGISLDVVLFKSVFCICTSLFKTIHGLLKKIVLRFTFIKKYLILFLQFSKFLCAT